MNGAQARAARAKIRELEAHRRAMKLQEEAITLFQRAGQPVYADNARQRARHARERLELALQEQREQQALMGARKAQPFSS